MVTRSLFILLLSAVQAIGGVHYVTSTGTGDGSSWSQAQGGFTGPLMRGDTYWLASGSYGSWTINPVDGTSWIYIKKATSGAHGTDVGWQASLGTGPAILSSPDTVLHVRCSYIDFDGVTGSGTTGHGIVLNSGSTVDGQGALKVVNGEVANSLHFHHVAMNNAPALNSNGSRVVFFNQQSPSDITFDYCYFSGGRNWITFGLGCTGGVIDHCYFANAGSGDPGLHSAGLALGNVTGFTIRYSTFENMLSGSTTYIEPQGHGTDGLDIYGNIFKATVPGELTSQGIMAITSSDIAVNVKILNNTCIGLHGGYPGVWGGNVPGSTVDVQNNVWKDCPNPPNFTQCSESGNIKNTGEVSFVNSAAGDFHLAADTSSGNTLGSPYNLDPDGLTRVPGAWSKGAYQFGGTPVTPPTPQIPLLSYPTFNAGDGLVAAPLTISGTSLVKPGGAYGGTMICNVLIPVNGQYWIEWSVRAPSLTSNSWYVGWNSDPTTIETQASDILPPTTGFETRAVSIRGTGTADLDQFPTNVWALTAGTNTLYIGGREPGTIASITLHQVTPPTPPPPPPPLAYLRFDVPGIYATNGTNTVTANVYRQVDTSETNTVDFTTVDSTALAGRNYVATNGTLTFVPGVALQSIPIQLLLDPVYRGDIAFYLRLQNPSSATLLLEPTNLLVMILPKATAGTAVYHNVILHNVK